MHINRFEEWGETFGPETEARRLSRRLAFIVQRYPAVKLGDHVQLKEGGWFLAWLSSLLPSEESAMWFGRVERIFQHEGPDGQKRMMLQASFLCNIVSLDLSPPYGSF